VVGVKIFSQFELSWLYQPTTNKAKKKCAKNTAKTAKFKKSYHKFEFKNFPKITASPLPDPQKPINPFSPAKSPENLAIDHLFFEIKPRFRANFTICRQLNGTPQTRKTPKSRHLCGIASLPTLDTPQRSRPCSPARRYAARAGRAGRGWNCKNALSALYQCRLQKVTDTRTHARTHAHNFPYHNFLVQVTRRMASIAKKLAGASFLCFI
jgi:hypothetical protein